jgi:hypothetical protein
MNKINILKINSKGLPLHFQRILWSINQGHFIPSSNLDRDSDYLYLWHHLVDDVEGNDYGH